jgi:hypothetical protein
VASERERERDNKNLLTFYSQSIFTCVLAGQKTWDTFFFQILYIQRIFVAYRFDSLEKKMIMITHHYSSFISLLYIYLSILLCVCGGGGGARQSTIKVNLSQSSSFFYLVSDERFFPKLKCISSPFLFSSLSTIDTSVMYSLRLHDNNTPWCRLIVSLSLFSQCQL